MSVISGQEGNTGGGAYTEGSATIASALEGGGARRRSNRPSMGGMAQVKKGVWEGQRAGERGSEVHKATSFAFLLLLTQLSFAVVSLTPLSWNTAGFHAGSDFSDTTKPDEQNWTEGGLV
jgi:hypothetical protein